MTGDDKARQASGALTAASRKQYGVPSAGGESPLCAVSRSLLLPPPSKSRAVIAVLNDAGYRELCNFGHDVVAEMFAPDTGPQAVRFVDVSLAQELRCCDESRLPDIFLAPWPRWPLVDAEQGSLSDGVAKLRIRITPDLAQLRGHFEAMPIVPGMTLVGWALGYARQFVGVDGLFAGLEGVKFRRIVQPGQELDLSVAHDRQRSLLEFDYRSEHSQYASGRIRLRPGLA